MIGGGFFLVSWKNLWDCLFGVAVKYHLFDTKQWCKNKRKRDKEKKRQICLKQGGFKSKFFFSELVEIFAKLCSQSQIMVIFFCCCSVLIKLIFSFHDNFLNNGKKNTCSVWNLCWCCCVFGFFGVKIETKQKIQTKVLRFGKNPEFIDLIKAQSSSRQNTLK